MTKDIESITVATSAPDVEEDAPRMKNLANCRPTEFMVQANRIRKAVEKWLTVTDLKNIRSMKPELTEIPITATVEEIERIKAENRDKLHAQGLKNLSKMFDAIFEEHPDESLEILALASFVEPGHIDDHTISEYLGSFNEIMNDRNVVSFFSSLMSLGQTSGLIA